MVGGAGPEAYSLCPAGGPLITGDSCYIADGGWWSDFRDLYLCHSVSTENCDTSKGGPFGGASFHWDLMRKFKN